MRVLAVVTCLWFVLAAGLSAADDAVALIGGHKELEIDRAVHDWGIARQNDRMESTFTYTNRGKETVTGIKAIGECGCNQITLSKTELKPGEAGKMNVTFETVMLSGHLNKLIRLLSDKRASGTARIQQKIAIIKGLIVSPSAVRFGEVRDDTALPKRTFRVKWYKDQGKPFQVTGASVPGYDLETSVRPYTGPKDANWQGYEIEVGFKTLPPLGMFSAEVVVDTNHPDVPRVTIALSANVTGKVWMQSRVLTFGSFYAEEKRKAAIRFRPRDKETKFGEVTARATKGRVEDVTVKVDPAHGDKGYWVLSARVPADAPPGSLEGEVIVLDPGIPGVAPIDVRVKGHVRDPAARRK